VEDALHATRAAVEEGIVPGGGTALLRALAACQAGDCCSVAANEDEKTGMGIVAKAVEAPLRQLAANAGREGALIVEKVKNNPEGHGYNVATDTYEDLIASGVVDPTKVTRSALQNAASISGLLLTTECVIADIPEKAAPGGGGHDHGMGGMGGMM
jgi:chaperonin GroEL